MKPFLPLLVKIGHYICSILQKRIRGAGADGKYRRTLSSVLTSLPFTCLLLEGSLNTVLASRAKLPQQCVGSQGLCVGRGEGRGTSNRCRRPSPREALLVRWDRRQVSSLTEQQRDGVADSGFSRADFAVSLDVCLGACRWLGILAWCVVECSRGLRSHACSLVRARCPRVLTR